MKTSIALSIWMAGIALLTPAISARGETDYTAQVIAKPLFTSPLEWVGTRKPSEPESAALLEAIGAFETNGVKMGFPALDKFLNENPESPWAPSLHVNVAEYYRQSGRYSLALSHWSAAWEATKESKEPKAQKIAVRSIASWTRLLASLGQKKELEEKFKELDGLQLPLGTYGTMIEGTKSGLMIMASRPREAYRCGSFALGNVAEALHLDKEIRDRLFQMNSPDGGFRISQLLTLAQTNGFPLQAVRRPPGTEIIVPSVVHWKLNHYAAIVEKKNDSYRVIDPTFEGYVWMDAATIDAETSGAFLVPKEKVPVQWTKLNETECAAIYGRGAPHGGPIDSDDGPNDCPPNDGEDDSDDPCDPPTPNDGASGGDDPPPPPCPDCGMPQWRVSEPYITLWLKDTPLFYKLSSGKMMKLTLNYKHRGEDKGSLIGNFGPKWECNWLGLFQAQSTTPDVFTNHLAGGGVRAFQTNGAVEYRSGRSFRFGVVGGASAPVLSGATGSQNAYGYSFGFLSGITNYFLTHRMDRYGRAVRFNHETVGNLVRIKTVVDVDGRTNMLTYGNTTFSNLITAVTDPYQQTAYFNYDSQGRLTNIVDAAGMSSSFAYDSNDNITNMITLYGTTVFQPLSGGVTDPWGGIYQRRGMLITEATGEKQLYVYMDQHGSALPTFHWDRAQYAAISAEGKTNIFDMPTADYLKATAKYWYTESEMISDSLWYLMRAAGASGFQTSAYSYSYTLKRLTTIATAIGSTSIERNALGRPVTFTYYHSDGKIASYTNTFDSSGRYLQTVYGPNGERVRGYGYHPVITNLLTSVTNALGEVIRYTHDTNTMKVTSITFPSGLVRSNIYYSSGTNIGFLAVQMELGIRTNSFGYANGNLSLQTNELGLVTTYTYDNLNRLVSTAYPDGTTVSNLYNRLDIVGVKDRMGQWTRYGFNSVRQLMVVTNAAGQVTAYDYCGCGSPSQITRWNGSTPVTTSYLYDMAGRLTNAVYADGYQLNYIYNSVDLVDTVKDNSGYQLQLYYRQKGSSFKVYMESLGTIYNSGVPFMHTFDEYGRIIQTIDRNNVTVTNAYDLLNRLVARRTIGNNGTDQTGLETFSYNPNGLAGYSDALGHITQYVRDAAGRVLFETNANNEALSYTYNPADELLTLTDDKNQTTRWNYDSFGRVTNKVDAANNVLFVYGYDPLDRLTNRWSAAKNNTVYKYDAIGNLTNVVYPVSSNIVFRYDGLNRLTNMVDGVGSTMFGWTAADQLASEDGPWASDAVNYSYTSRVRSGLSLAQPSTAAWAQSYGYDEIRRLTNVISPAGEFGYQYTFSQSDGVRYLLLPNQQGPWGAYHNNAYDGLMRLTSTALETPFQSPANKHQYGYNEGNQRTQQVFSVDNYYIYHSMNYTYDAIGQLQTALGFESDGTTPRLQEQFGYGYDSAWNLNKRTNNAMVQTFNVDNRNQLTNATRSGPFTMAGSANEHKGGYFYWGYQQGVTNVTVSGTGLTSGEAELYMDGSWARTNATLADGNNSYTAIGKDTYERMDTNSVSVNLPATSTFLYDLNGNLRTNNTRIFDYDDENQLIRVTEPSKWKSEFAYDGMMRRRIRKEFSWNGSWVQTNEVRYVYDGRLVMQERDANNLPQLTYTRGNDLSGTRQGAGGIGGLLARTSNPQLLTSDPNAHAYYHCDGNGNVTAMVNTNGMIVARYNYDPYGNILSLSGLLADANTYRHASKEWHDNAGIYYYGRRFYDPNLQRWLNRDPIGELGGVNLYDFVFNRPLGLLDIFGLDTVVGVPSGIQGPPPPGVTWVYPSPMPPEINDGPIRDESMDMFNAISLASGACSLTKALANQIAMREALAAEAAAVKAVTAARERFFQAEANYAAKQGAAQAALAKGGAGSNSYISAAEQAQAARAALQAEQKILDEARAAYQAAAAKTCK